jgi:hypothetical protein
MSEDSSKTTASLSNNIENLIEKLGERIYFWLSLGGLILLAPVFFLISYWSPEKSSWWGPIQLVALREFFLGLIIGLIPVCVIVMLSFKFTRPYRAIKDQFTSDQFAENIANKTQVNVEIPLKTMQQTIERLRATLPADLTRVLEHAELGRTAYALGVGGITCDWTEFAYFTGTLGERLKTHLIDVKDATWYIVTMSPQGFQNWLPEIEKAVEKRGIDVKWVYYAPKSIEACDALSAQLEWLSRPRKRLERLQHNINRLYDTVERSSNQIHQIDGEPRKRAGRWELYESKVPHFYMAFLSVPRKNEESPKQVPDGTFGFVCLYPMFPHKDKHETRPALYLEASGQIQPNIIDCYYWSIVQMFDEGVKRGYLWPTWPSGV